jgi:hypothetical protein
MMTNITARRFSQMCEKRHFTRPGGRQRT